MDNYNNINPNGNQQNNYQQNQMQYNYQQNGYQQQNQMQYGYQQNGYQQQNQMQYGYQQQNNQMQYVNQPGTQPVNQQTKEKPGDSNGPKKKTGLIIALISILAVILIGAGVVAAVFYMTERKDKEAAQKTASGFVNAYGNQDFENLQGYFPKRLLKEDDIVNFTHEAKYEGAKYYSYTVTDVDFTDIQKYDANKAAKTIKDTYDKHLTVDKAYSVSVKYTETYVKNSSTVENEMTDKIICGKIDEKWYVLDPTFISNKNQMIADFDKEADDDQSKDVVEKLMTSISESNIDGVDECFASSIKNHESTKKGKETITESFSKLDEYGIKFTFGEFNISEPEEYDIAKAKERIKSDYEVEPAFIKCRKFTVDYSVTIEADGESSSHDVTEEFICGKEDGKWYIYNSDILTTHNDLFAEIIDKKETEIDVEEVRTTINGFVESLALLDIETIKSYMPDVVLNDEEVASTISKLESQKSKLDSYGVVLSLDSVEIGTITKENPTAIMWEVMIGYQSTVLNIEKAYSTTVTFSRSATLMGRVESDEITSDMICAKIDGKWYIVHATVNDEE